MPAVQPIDVHGSAPPEAAVHMHAGPPAPEPSSRTSPSPSDGSPARASPPSSAHGPAVDSAGVSSSTVVDASSSAASSSAPAPALLHPMVTRTRDATRREKDYTDGTVRYDPLRRAFFVTPVSHRDALREPAWHAAMSDEFAALRHTNTWVLVPRPPGVNIVGSKWVFKTKQ